MNMPEYPNRRIPFTKMHGSGNDFVVVDNRDGVIPPEHVASFARAICRPHLGLGADGVVLIDDASDEVDFIWRYINADGTDGDLCGNGAMCGARFAVDAGIAPAECTFETPAGEIRAVVETSGLVTVDMVDARIVAEGLHLSDDPAVSSFDQVMMGVPHVVAFTPDADAKTGFDDWGRAIRHHPAVQPAGANVNLVHRLGANTIRMRTYERGVEAETLACGTGSVSSAIVSARRGLVRQPVNVVTTGGRTIRVSWTPTPDGATDIRMTGEATFVARGEIEPEALR
jgi:diaminopimelate epimerase